MAEQLGEAVLRITIDDDAARDQLRALRQEIEGTTGATRISRARRSSASSGEILGPQNGPGIDRDTVRRFNLRGLNAALESIAEDINSIRTARQVNIGSSWTKALEFLQEAKESIDSISASKNLNLRSSWSAALALLSETKEDIDSISASKNLNLRASWAKALGQLSEIQEDLAQVAAAKDLNLNASWAGALATLSEIDADLQNIAAGKKLNIRASWQTALRQLQETADEAARIRLKENIAEGRRIGAQNVSPIRGGAAFPGSPAYLDAIFKDQNKRVQDAAKRRADILSNALIGGAFPALFGQGPGASLGGAAGGAAGGAIGGQFGFGLSLVGTALGTSFDALIARSKELAEALRDPISSFDQLKAASVLSSRALETYIDALIKTGQTAKAEQLIRADLTQNVNPTTAAALSQTNDEVARSFSDVQEKLSALVAGPAIAFLQWLDDIIDRLPIQGPGGAAPGQLPSLEAARAQTEAGRQTQGVGLSLGAAAIGSILAGIGLTATGVGAPAGLAALTYGLTGAAAVTVASGKVQQSQGAQAETDIQTQQATAGIQKEIEAIQARRVALQKQLVGFTGNENSAGAQLAQTQNVVLNAQEAILRARKEYVSIPANSTPKEEARAFQAYKDAVAAARLEVEKLIAANNNQARNLERDTDLAVRTTGFTPAAQQEAELTDQLTRAREDYDKALQALSTASGPGLKAAQSDVNVLGEKWRAASQSLNEYNSQQTLAAQRQREINADALTGLQQSAGNILSLRGADAGPERERLAIELSGQERINEATREQVRLRKELDRIAATGTDAEVENVQALLAQATAKVDVASQQSRLSLQEFDEQASRASAAVGLQEFDEQASRASAAERQATLESAMADAMSRAQEAASEFANAGQRMQEASNNVRAAADGLRSAREGAFEFLRPDVQQSLVDDARAVYQQVSDFRALPTNLSDQEVLRAGNAARSVLGAQEQMTQANSELVEATRALADKDWLVNVNVQGGSASAYGDVVNQAVSV